MGKLWSARRRGKSAQSVGRKKKGPIGAKKKENMNSKEIIKRRIELKKQLIMLTQKEIKELEEQLSKTAGDRVIPENRQPEPASLA